VQKKDAEISFMKVQIIHKELQTLKEYLKDKETPIEIEEDPFSLTKVDIESLSKDNLVYQFLPD